METKIKNQPSPQLIDLVQKITDLEHREKALLSHNQELREHVSFLKKSRDSLQEENIRLKQQLKDVLLGYDDSSEFFDCIYPPYDVAHALNLSSREVGNIVKDLELEKYKGLCRRIKQIKRKDPAKHETTLVFSEFGILVLKEILSYCLKNPEASPRYYDYVTRGKANNPNYLKWRDKLLKHYHDVWEALAKKKIIYLTEEQVLDFQKELIDQYKGVHGILDKSRLESSLECVKQTFDLKLLFETLEDIAGAYFFISSKIIVLLMGIKEFGYFLLWNSLVLIITIHLNNSKISSLLIILSI